MKDEKNRKCWAALRSRCRSLSRIDEGAARSERQDIEGWLRPADVKAQRQLACLFERPAGNRRVEGEMNLTAVLPRFARIPDYRFQIGEVSERTVPRNAWRLPSPTIRATPN